MKNAQPITLEMIVGLDNNKIDAQHRYRVVIEPGNPLTRATLHGDLAPFYENQNGPILSVGVSICKHGDCYDMGLGCKLALMSAFRRAPYKLPKEVRAGLWSAFFEVFPRMPKAKQRAKKTMILQRWLLQTLAEIVA